MDTRTPAAIEEAQRQNRGENLGDHPFAPNLYHRAKNLVTALPTDRRNLCAVCALPPARLAALHDAMYVADPDLIGICRTYSLSPRDVLGHAHTCIGEPMAERNTVDTNVAIAEFANEIVVGLQRSIGRAESILNDLYEIESNDPDTGEVSYPHRTIALAESYTKVAKVYGTTLDGVISAAQRKQMDQRLNEIERIAADPGKVGQAQAAFADPTSNVHPFTPRRSIAAMLDLLPATGPLDPLSATPAAPDPFEGL
jgi:hypothetical protein